VTLLVIDPYLVHAYWDVDSATLPEAARGVLRVYDTTGEATSYFDVPVSFPSRNWYIHLWTPERSYYAEIGLSEEASGFTPLARSNSIQTPRAWPAAEVELSGAPQPTLPDDRGPISASEPPPLPLVTAQQPDVQPEGVEQIAQPVAALPSRDREGAVFPPRLPEPVDAARILRTRLEEIYASLEWIPRPREAAESPANPPAPAANPNKPGDLTQLAEEHFATGISSKTPKPAG
jgi:hypothetical protein